MFLGIFAMLSVKRPGRHPWFGSVYYWCLIGVFVTASGLAAVRWRDDYHLFILGALAFAAAYLGRRARRKRWNNWVKLHITGMGSSYVLLLTAFYVDNGRTCRSGEIFRRSPIGSCPPRLEYHSLIVPCCGIRWRGRHFHLDYPKSDFVWVSAPV